MYIRRFDLFCIPQASIPCSTTHYSKIKNSKSSKSSKKKSSRDLWNSFEISRISEEKERKRKKKKERRKKGKSQTRKNDLSVSVVSNDDFANVIEIYHNAEMSVKGVVSSVKNRERVSGSTFWRHSWHCSAYLPREVALARLTDSQLPAQQARSLENMIRAKIDKPQSFDLPNIIHVYHYTVLEQLVDRHSISNRICPLKGSQDSKVLFVIYTKPSLYLTLFKKQKQLMGQPNQE
ncbi:spermatogenesis-associated protein 13 isoform X3 [Vespula squamosa]|uniref:Spermatogenesis-associated protein 13 isoform X3 n=1 Tax=Vespula squamosa TaxID=30214 RepID=A0ABD2C7B5_VESSQ